MVIVKVPGAYLPFKEVRAVLGHVVLVEQKGGKPRAEVERVRGLTLLRLEVPLPPGSGEGTVRRRLGRGARLLRREGVRRVLVEEGFPWWDLLREWELLPVDPAPLCEALASALALAALGRRGIAPGRATVALRGNRVSRPFFQAAMELAPLVRTLTVVSPNGGEALAAYLRREYGVPVLEEGAGPGPDLTLEFSISKGGEEERLVLHGSPNLQGLRLEPPEGAWPPGFETLPLAAALWEVGALSLNDMKLS